MTHSALPRPGDDDLLLQRALDDELRPSERIEFEARLEAEPDLRQRLTSMEAMRDLRHLARPRGGLGLDFADRVVAQCQAAAAPEMDTEESTPAEPVRLRSWLEAAIVLAASVLLLLGVSLFARGDHDSATMQASPEVREEVRQLYEKLAEEERLRRVDVEMQIQRSEAAESETRGSDKDR